MDMIPILILIITYLVISSWSVFTTIVNPQLERTKNYCLKNREWTGNVWNDSYFELRTKIWKFPAIANINRRKGAINAKTPHSTGKGLTQTVEMRIKRVSIHGCQIDQLHNKGKRRKWPFQGHLGVTEDHEFILTFINFFPILHARWLWVRFYCVIA